MQGGLPYVGMGILAIAVAFLGYALLESKAELQASEAVREALARKLEELERDVAMERESAKRWQDTAEQSLAVQQWLDQQNAVSAQQRALEAQQEALDSIAESARRQADIREKREERIQAYYECLKRGGTRRQCLQ